MGDWKEQAENMFFMQGKNINRISEELKISRQSISAYLKTVPLYKHEREKRKEDNRAKRKVYKAAKNKEYRENYRMLVTAETMRREHDLAVMELSHER